MNVDVAPHASAGSFGCRDSRQSSRGSTLVDTKQNRTVPSTSLILKRVRLCPTSR